MPKRGIFNGADAMVATLADLGVRCVFGLPGSQNIELFESLRNSEVRTVLAASEAAAGFMANGWFRSCGQPGVFLAIPGPGFAWAIAPLAEAALDSAATILITGKPPERGFKHDLQYLEQASLATALNCPVFDIDTLDSLVETVREAWSASTDNGPRPVIIQISPSLLEQDWLSGRIDPLVLNTQPDVDRLDSVLLARVKQATRPVILAGAGTLDHAEKLQEFRDATGALLLTTPTARGVIPESHPMCLALDFLCHGVDVLNPILEASDLVIALGCRFSHNGTGGFGMRLDSDKLIHVDADRDVLQSNYHARWPLCMDVGEFLEEAIQCMSRESTECLTDWQQSDVEAWRKQMRERARPMRNEPVWKKHGECDALFQQIREGTPDDGIVVTDTGLHQILTRNYFDVLSPRGLIFPSDLQSMGFGLPAAIGAAMAVPDRSVIALIGDGSLMMVGAELLAAKREAIALPVLVFCDGSLGQIRLQQIENFGYEAATRLERIDLAMYCKSLGIGHVLGGANLGEQIKSSFNASGPTIIEIQLHDDTSLDVVRKKARRKRMLKASIGPGAVQFLKRLRR